MPCFDGGGNESYSRDYGNEVREHQRKIHDLDEKNHKALDKIQAQENELCDLRNLVVQLLGGGEVDEKIVNKFKNKVRDTQLAHRKEERNFRVNFIKRELEKLKANISQIEKLGGTPKVGLLRTKKKMENEISRILLLTDDQLLDKEKYPF